MDNEDLGKLSTEQLQNFDKILTEIKLLPKRYDELIEKALAGEAKVAAKRAEQLRVYFDEYSERLDKIISKSYTLYESLSTAGKKFTKGFIPTGTPGEPPSSGKKGTSTDDKSRGTPASSGGTDSHAAEELTSAIKSLKDVVDVVKRDALGSYSLLSKKDLGLAYKETIDTLKRSVQDGQVQLDFARSQEGSKGKLKEYTLTAEKAVLTEELALQDLLNTLKAEQTFAQTEPQAGEFRAREVNARAELDSARELAKRKAEFIAKAELDARLQNNGILTEDEAARIQATAAIEFEASKENLHKLTKERLEQEQQIKDLANNPKLAQARETAMANYKAKLELEARRKNNGILSAEDAKDIQKQADQKFKLGSKAVAKLAEEQLKADKKARAQAGDQAIKSAISGPIDKENNLLSRFESLKALTKDEEGNTIKGATFAVAVKTLSSLVQKLENTIDQVASYKGIIDTRLQGSSNEKWAGSYWDQLVHDITKVGAVTPFFKQEDFAKNIESLVDRGIAFDLKQRAFLMTIQEKIANTFDVADGTLLRLIRLQQEDSTAGRLGMESALNSFLNEMYENTEYLKNVAANVRGSLQEMEALMTGAEATAVEYQVQKWMGSLYSVGMSDAAVNTISTALGQIAAGQIEGLVNGGAGNLLVMAANNAGIPIADILATGLTADDTNKLLQATVNYLAEIAKSSAGNNVVQQQLANVFGVKASDLKAATNLATPDTLSSISGSNLTYQNMLGQLFKMAGSMGQRTSMGEMMSNVWANGQYTLAGSMASNPVSYLLYKVASLVDATTGGIPIPSISTAFVGVDLETTVTDIMRLGAVGTGILGSFGAMVQGLGNSFDGRSMLNKLGIKSDGQLAINQRGTGSIGALEGGAQQTLSSSGYVGNAKDSDIKGSTMQAAEDEKKRQMIKAKEEEPSSQVDMINTSVLKIYEILDEVTKGSKTLRVRVDNYGLTGENTRITQGGTASLLDSGETSSSLGANPSSSNKHTGITGSMVDLGGWTMM